MICPKCNYKRKKQETVGDDQCPSCGIYYAKFNAQPQVFTRASTTRVVESKSSFPTFIVVVAATASVGPGAAEREQRGGDDSGRAKGVA